VKGVILRNEQSARDRSDRGKDTAENQPAPMPRAPNTAELSPALRTRRAVIIFNPTAGPLRRRQVDAAVDRLREAVAHVDVLATSHRGHAVELARDAAAGAAIVIAAGGDGTVAEVVDGLLSWQELSSKAAPILGILPMGTANVLAAELALPSGIGAIDRIISGAVRPVRFGFVEGDGIKRRPFVAMVGAGFDADVVASVTPGLKRRLGRGAYAIQAIRRLFGDCGAKLQVRLDDGPPIAVASVVACNTRFYAGRFVLAASARLEDPTLQVCLFRRGGRGAALRCLASMVTHRMPKLPDTLFAVTPAQKIEITADPGCETAVHPVQADGDHIGALPARVWVAPGLLQIAV
jgi:diacylglycerol kinase (ATP)